MSNTVNKVLSIALDEKGYLEKKNLYKDNLTSGMFEMSDEILEMYIRQYIESQTMQQVLFTWHGGEPTLAGLDFYRRISRDYAAHLNPGGALLMEVGAGQAEDVAAMFPNERRIKDICGIERVVTVRG